MKSVIVDKENVALTVKRSGIVVGEQHIPFRLVDILVLASNVAMDSKTLLSISKEGVSVLILSKNNSNFCLTHSLEAKNSELKLKQYSSIMENRVGFAKYFLEEKIKSHASLLGSFGKIVDKRSWLEKVDSADTISQLLGIEGSFAKIFYSTYFSLLPKSLHKGKRTKRPPMDPVNAMLSYLYSWCYSLITARLHTFGFDPSLSYLHEPYRSHYGLSSDILEIFRADVAKTVLEWFQDELIGAKDFTKKSGVWLRYESRKELWPKMKEFTESITPDIDKEIALLRSSIS